MWFILVVWDMIRHFRRVHTETLYSALSARGLISQVTSPHLAEMAEQRQLGVYLGADPSADSLHLGNLMPFMVLMHFYLRGHRVFPLIGGATGVVGDPSGRKDERSAMAAQQRLTNVDKIQNQMSQILGNCRTSAAKYQPVAESGEISPVNNANWWQSMGMLEFLGTFGRHIRVSSMLARESVKQRLSSEAGIGYNEFSYQVLQAYDFYHLYTQHGCQCQIGGHDQWGNITAVTDLINRLRPSSGDEPLGLTVPLLTTPSGEKFGKSAGNAVFLSAERTAPYHLYQYLVKSPDEAVEKYLKLFTFIPLPEIAHIVAEHNQRPEARVAQGRLAFEVTELVHGTEQAHAARIVSEAIFGAGQESPQTLLAAFRSQNLVVSKQRDELREWKALVAELSGKSKSEAQRLVKQQAVYYGINREPVTSAKILDEQIIDGVLLVRVGKTEYYVVEVL